MCFGRSVQSELFHIAGRTRRQGRLGTDSRHRSMGQSVLRAWGLLVNPLCSHELH